MGIFIVGLEKEFSWELGNRFSSFYQSRGIVMGQASTGYLITLTKHLFFILESIIRGIILDVDTQDNGKLRPRSGRLKITSD